MEIVVSKDTLLCVLPLISQDYWNQSKMSRAKYVLFK